MTPPPDTLGDEFPDFDSMTPEEQMAWLESLAKRQGVGDEELTTAADLDIPVPENAVIDEPGYVPYSISDKPAASKAAPAPKPEPEPEPEPELLPVEDEGDDPMQWLGTLSADASGDLGLDESLDLPDDLLSDLGVPEEAPITEAFIAPPEPELEAAPAAEAEVPVVDDDDPLGGMDPMLFLETLAARQGVSHEQLTTAANMEIPDVPDDAVIDEPGYVPYDVVAGGPRKMQELEPEPEPEPVAAPEPEPEPVVAPEPELEFDLDLDLDLDLSPEPAEASADWAMAEAGEDLEAADEALSWLQDLAAEPDAGMSDLFDMGDDLLGDLDEIAAEEASFAPEPEPAPEPPAPVAQAQSDDPLAGLSDEDVARMQASGDLTPQQELAWLKRQASKLAEARETSESDVIEDLPPAQPAEALPDWLEQMREQEPSEDAAAALFEEMVEPAGVPDWLDEAAEPAELELDTGMDVESLWADAVDEQPASPEPALDLDPESELAAFLEGDFTPDVPDQLAEALDAEYERRVTGDQSEPDWYAEAVSQASDAPDEMPPAVIEEPAPATGDVLAQAEPMDMPDWLRPQEDEPAVVADEADMPDWVMESVEEVEAEIEPGDIPDWLRDESVVDEGVDWIGEEAEAPQAAIEPELPVVEPPQAATPAKPVPAPPPVPEPAVVQEPVFIEGEATPPAVPEGELFDQYRQRLEEDPADFATRLALARALWSNQRSAASLDQYEALIDHTQLLQDVANDLSHLAAEHAQNPRLQRMLGDVYMRRGMLQEALESYRSALEQL